MSLKSFLKRNSQRINLTIGLLITALFLWLAVRKVPLAEVKTSFRSADYTTLPAIWIMLFAFYWLKALRWRYFLLPVKPLPTSSLFRTVLIGFAFNNVLPAHLGDLVRTYFLSRQQKLPLTAVLSSVALERVIDILVIFGFLLTGLLAVPNLDPRYKTASYIMAGLAAVAILLVLFLIIWTRRALAIADFALRLVPFFPLKIKTKILSLMHAAIGGLSSLKSPTLIVGILLTSIAQWALNGAMMWLSLWSFNLPVSPLAACVLLGVVAFGVTIPSSPGYFGVIQICFWVVMQLFFPDRQADVFGASIYYHLSNYIPVTILGLYFANRAGLSWRELQHSSTAEESSPSPLPVATHASPN